MCQPKDRFTLSVGVSVKRVRLNVGAVFQQAIQDVDGLPNAAGNEVAKQCDVGVGDVVVGNPAVAAITNVTFANQIVFTQLNMLAISDRSLTTAP